MLRAESAFTRFFRKPMRRQGRNTQHLALTPSLAYKLPRPLFELDRSSGFREFSLDILGLFF